MNKVILIGRITKDIELRYTTQNKAVISYTLAVKRDKDNTDFINCVVWEKQAENMAKYCSKGSLIAIEGKITTRNYDDKNGKKVYIIEVVTNNIQFLDTKKQEAKKEEKYINSEDIVFTDDDLPF